MDQTDGVFLVVNMPAGEAPLIGHGIQWSIDVAGSS